MDHSTEGVTLYAAFVQDILNMYEGKPQDHAHLQDMVAGIDLSKPDNPVPIAVYNQMCDYVLQQIGPANTKLLGGRIGDTVFQVMVSYGLIPERPTPLQVMEALVHLARTVIDDPKGRGWEILESGPRRILMRRTQTFNGVLQLGLLSGLLGKCNVGMARVNFAARMEDGAPFDDYVLTWM